VAHGYETYVPKLWNNETIVSIGLRPAQQKGCPHAAVCRAFLGWFCIERRLCAAASVPGIGALAWCSSDAMQRLFQPGTQCADEVAPNLFFLSRSAI
jgi:hypothetical protein